MEFARTKTVVTFQSSYKLFASNSRLPTTVLGCLGALTGSDMDKKQGESTDRGWVVWVRTGVVVVVV